MSRGTLIAPLPAFALAEHQNRYKIGGILNGRKTAPARRVKVNDPPLQGRRLSQGGFNSAPVGGIVTGGSGRLLERCRKRMGGKADSWVATGSNQRSNEPDLALALGDEVIGKQTAGTSLSRVEILSRLLRDLPNAADDLTPDISSEDELGTSLRDRSSCSGEPIAEAKF